MLNDIIDKMPEHKKEDIRKILNQPNFYSVTFDRDQEYNLNYKFKEALEEIGFTLETNDY